MPTFPRDILVGNRSLGLPFVDIRRARSVRAKLRMIMGAPGYIRAAV